MMRAGLLVAVILLGLLGTSSCVQDIYVGGDFLLTIVGDNGLSHTAGIVSYNPDNDVFEDKFDGGVYTNIGASIRLIEFTPSGLFVAGAFRFVGAETDYSNSVAQYDDDDDNHQGRLLPLDNGIWTGNGDNIRFIAGVGDSVVFAGKFSAQEDIDYQSYKDGVTAPIVPNIISWSHSAQTWQLLSGGETFPTTNLIGGVATAPNGKGSLIYIYEMDGDDIYSWSSDQGFTKIINNVNLVQDTLIVDANGNLAGISMIPIDLGPESPGRDYSLWIYSDGITYSKWISNYTASTVSEEVLAIPYMDGILVAASDSADVSKTQFAYVTSTSSPIFNLDFTSTTIPALEGETIVQLVAGAGSDLWLGTNKVSDSIYYYNNRTTKWSSVYLDDLGITQYTATSFTWDWQKQKLYAYGLSKCDDQGVWFAVAASSPPQPKNPTAPYTDGIISATTVVENDDDSLVLWVGGRFSAVGNGIVARNLASWTSDNGWTGYSYDEVSAITSYGDYLYISYAKCVVNNDELPIGYAPINSDDDTTTDPFGGYIPILIGGTGCVTALYTYNEKVYVGGDFTVVLADGQTSASGVLVFDPKQQTWSGLNNMPIDINSASSGGYEINAFSVGESFGPKDSDVLFIGGQFEFTAVNGDYQYNSFAAYDLDEQTFIGSSSFLTLGAGSVVSEIITDVDENVFIGGNILSVDGASSAQGVFFYNFETPAYTSVGQLRDNAKAILLLTTDDKDPSTIVYAGGSLNDTTNTYAYGVANYDWTSQLAGGSYNSTWNWVGSSSMFGHYYYGEVFQLVYQSGGVGENGENGNDPDVGSSSKHNGWWISLLVIFFLGLCVLLVVGVVGGVWFYKKKVAYQQIE